MLTIEDIMLVEHGHYNEALLERLQTALDNGTAFQIYNPVNENIFIRNVKTMVDKGLLKCEALKNLTMETEN